MLWLGIILVIIAPRLFDLDVFFARDELTIWRFSDEFTTAIWHGDLAGTLIKGSNYPGIPMFWAQTLFLTFKYAFPGLFPQTMIPVDQLFQEHGLPLLAERRLVAALFVSLEVLGCVWLVSRLLGRRAALLAAILLSLDPFSLSEARLLRLEMASALFACISVLAYLLYRHCRQRTWLVLSGAAAGLAVISKMSAGLIVPFIWLLLLLDLFWGPAAGLWPRFKRVVGDGLIWAGTAIGTLWLVWPAMWLSPIETVRFTALKGLAASADSVWHGPAFFWGQLFPSEDPGLLFYPVVLAFRTTPLTWLGVAVALVLLARFVRRRLAGQAAASRPRPFARPAVVAGLLLVYVILVVAELTGSRSKTDRYLLLVFPVLNLVSAIGLAALVKWLAAAGRRTATRRPQTAGKTAALFNFGRRLSAVGGHFGLAALVVLGVHLLITLPAHPYYFTYWNPLVGGGRAAMTTLPMGAGEGVDLAMDYLNSQPGAAEALLVCGGSEPWCANKFKGQTLRYASYVSGEWVRADYASLYISQLQRDGYPPEIITFLRQQPLVYQVDLAGATYMEVYQVPEIAHFAGPFNNLAGLGQLLGYNLAPAAEGGSQVRAGEPVTLAAWWTNRGAGVANLVVRLVDETGYEVGRAPLVPAPAYAGLAPDQIAIVTGTAELTVPWGTPPGNYALRLGVVAPGSDRLLGEFELPAGADRVMVLPGGRQPGPTEVTMPRPVNQALTPAVTLLGYAPPEQVLTASVPTWLALVWQATASPADYQVALRLLDGAGQEAARWQGRPGHDRYPTSTWQPGEIVRDVWALTVPAQTPVGRYHLDLLLLDPAGTPVPGAGPVDLGPVEVWPQPITYDIPPMQVTLRANFGNRLTLLGYDLYFDVAGAGGNLSPYFYWQSPADLAAAFDLHLTLRAGDGQVLQEWRVPLGTDGVKTSWKAGEVVNTMYRFEAGPLVTGRYSLDIALLDAASGEVEPVSLDDQPSTEFVRLDDIQAKIVVRTADDK